MAILIHFYAKILFSLSLLLVTYGKDDDYRFEFNWLDNKRTFKAGDVVIIKTKVIGDLDKFNRSLFNPTLTVNGKIGNSPFISGVRFDQTTLNIFFTPLRAGNFTAHIVDKPNSDYPLPFEVKPAQIYPSACIASWMRMIYEFKAGDKATVLVFPRDAYGNTLLSTGEPLTPCNFTLSGIHANGSIASVPNVTHLGWNELSRNIEIEFIATKAGTFSLNVEGGNQTLKGSPLPFKVNPGPIEVSNCVAKWKFDTNMWQLFSNMEVFIHQQDQYGNLVPGSYVFDAVVIQLETKLSMPVNNLEFKEVEPGIQLLSFSLLKPGNFLLSITDFQHNQSISNMPFAYTVFVGYCDGIASIVNGSGLNDSVAGEASEFSIYLIDKYQNPTSVKLESISVHIALENDSYSVQPIITPILDGNAPSKMESFEGISHIETVFAPALEPAFVPALAPFINQDSSLPGDLKVSADAFSVMFTPEKSGTFQIYAFCGNILLNGGHPFRKQVRPGEVNITVSRTVKFDAKVPKLKDNAVVVQLMDAFSNPVASQQSRLTVLPEPDDNSNFSKGEFVDNNDGSYIGHYKFLDVGTFEICVIFDGQDLAPCPFQIDVYSDEYFPKASDDHLFVWEDESIDFNVVANDSFIGPKASIIEFSKPSHGSLLNYISFFRYTPYEDYHGNDSFVYTISDVHGNFASATVNITVGPIPPHLVFISDKLQAIEDIISPQNGSGFSGIRVKYSTLTESITVTLSVYNGTLVLSPIMMQFWQPISGEFSVTKEDKDGSRLILEARVEVINSLLQHVQYIGNGNFNGDDHIQVSAHSKIGGTVMNFPVLVEPVNDPPFIKVPEKILMDLKGESLIFDKERDKTEFFVGDPDLEFVGEESQFIVSFSVEVTDGVLMTSLPVEVAHTTELKLMNSNQWQPLQDYVAIQRRFIVRANGVRFRGSINDCNSIMEHLSYHGRKGIETAILTVRVNDMGHHGCASSDCSDNTASALFAEANVLLTRDHLLSSLEAYVFGSAFAIEFLVVIPLGTVFLFFTCKCTVLLLKERKESSSFANLANPDPSQTQTSQSFDSKMRCGNSRIDTLT